MDSLTTNSCIHVEFEEVDVFNIYIYIGMGVCLGVGVSDTSKTRKGSNDSPWLWRRRTAALNMGFLPF